MSVGVFECSSITQSAVASISQHDTAPLSRMAQVWELPERRYCCATCTEAAGERGCGFERSSFTQSAVVSSPQHDTAPLSRMAQVWNFRKRALLLCDLLQAAGERGCWLSDHPHYPIGHGSVSPARHSTVVKDGAGVVTEESATAVRPVPRLLVSVGVVCQMFLRCPIGRVPFPSTTSPLSRMAQVWRARKSATAVRPVPRLLVSVGVVCQMFLHYLIGR